MRTTEAIVAVPRGNDNLVVRRRGEAFHAEAPLSWEPVLNAEHDDYRWCTRQQARALLHWPEPYEIVELLP